MPSTAPAGIRHADDVITVMSSGGVSFPCPEGETLLRAALRAGIPVGYECNSGGCGTCKVVVMDGQVEQLVPDPPGLTERDRRKGKLLACQSVPRTDCTVTMSSASEWPAGHARPRRMAVEVIHTRALTHDLHEITLRGECPANFLPGQYAMLTVDQEQGGTEAARPERAYSMSNVPNRDGLWQFQVKRVPGGRVSPRLVEHLRTSDRLVLDGPYGHAHLQDSDRDVVCIAGGSGLAPMVSVARGLAARPDAAQRQLHFFYGGRREEDLCAREFVDEVTPALRKASLSEAISEEPANGWQGIRGFVHELVAAYDLPDLAEHEIYVAGPPMMTDAVVRFLVLERGVPAERVHFDRFY
ncbi:Toluene-4-monooxygenase electron transfer component [Nocardia cyriacigeorgica]|uniref:Toluene-4-monooxygenase electron transfer component n=2 Tax=Nocardia cyriacigeorgica TaxID=135487 RepID=A0A4U8W5W8_9NOCA|nr:Toluene-4-monooxygenase electron transfer component [Nocardia cyriacigeorgica]